MGGVDIDKYPDDSDDAYRFHPVFLDSRADSR